MTLSSVVLPEPDRPTSATMVPAATSNDTSRSACTAVGPVPKLPVHPAHREQRLGAHRRSPRRAGS